jgi:hypothetical protein
MGLAVEVGMLADLNVNDEEGAAWLRESLSKVNEVLAENGLASHTEPEVLPALKSRAIIGSYPYSFLHYLRRFAAHAWTNPHWKPTPFTDSEDPAEDSAVAGETAMLTSHLLCHSDCDGFYLPIDFKNPLFADEDCVPGGMLGSSQGLMRELVGIAPFLGVQLTGGNLWDTEVGRINGIIDAEGPFWIEHAVWISLFEAARLSIEHKSAICFS